jgi:lysozyme
MTTSQSGIDALTLREAVVLTMYRDSAGLPTIGIGHLLTKDELSSGKLWLRGAFIKWGRGLTMQQAQDLLRKDLRSAESAVSGAVRVALSQSQFDSLVSFAFNIGGSAFTHSTLVTLLNTGNYGAVPAQLQRWVYAAGQISPGLVTRRTQEAQQWESA